MIVIYIALFARISLTESSFANQVITIVAVGIIVRPLAWAANDWRRGGAYYLVGSAIGLYFGFAWLEKPLHNYGLYSEWLCRTIMILLSILVALVRTGLFLSGRVLGCTRLLSVVPHFAWICLAEAIACYIFPWSEVVSLHFICAYFPGSSLLIYLLGPTGYTFILCAVGSLLSRRIWIFPVLIFFAIGVNYWNSLEEIYSDRIKVPVLGLQIPPLRRIAEDRAEQQIAHFLQAEGNAKEQINIWPEGAYPYPVPLLRHKQLPLLPPPNEGNFRVLGAQISNGMLNRYNAAIVQNSSSIAYRIKGRLVPIYEQDMFSTLPSSKTFQLKEFEVVIPICYEIFDRAYWSSLSFNIGISISSDLFDESGIASLLMDRATWLRAVECGSPFIRVSNVSGSIIVSDTGRVLAWAGSGPAKIRAVLSVPKGSRTPCGGADRFSCCALAALMLVLVGYLLKLRKVR